MTLRLFVDRIEVVSVSEPRTQYKTTDYRRKLLQVVFSNGLVWVPTVADLYKLQDIFAQVYNENLLFGDPDKERAHR